jgi:hypothetical protein
MCAGPASPDTGSRRATRPLSLALALTLAGPVAAEPGLPHEDVLAPYRADLLPPLEPGEPAGVELLRPPGAAPLPEPVQEDLKERILREWSPDRPYGGIHSVVGLWLEYPLLNARLSERIAVPVLESTELPIRGRVIAPPPRFSGNLVILIDVSSSANARTALWREDGSLEQLRAIGAELRAARELLEILEQDRARFGPGYGPASVGILAFGESTTVIADPESSIAEARVSLEALQRLSPEGTGRTDAVCALRLASDWLAGPSEGLSGEIVILTDGDLPFSGRFTDCGAPHYRSRDAEAACHASLNRSPCASSHPFDPADGRSDVAQLFSFVRDVRGRIRVFPTVFRLKRPPRFLREIATYTGGHAVSVASDAETESALLGLLEHAGDSLEVRGVYVRNLRSGEATENLLEANGTDFTGALPLAPGPNDVELRIESDLGEVGLYRFRVYAAPDAAGDYLARLLEANRALERRLEDLLEEAREGMQERRRSPGPRNLEITLETPAPAPTAPERTSAEPHRGRE